MKYLLALTLIVASAAFAGATVDIASPPGIYAEGVVTLDAPGTVRWNTRAIDLFYLPYVLDGSCQFDTVKNQFTNLVTKVGFTCATPGQVHLTTTGQLTATCPYDGGTLESLHLTLQLDGATFYDEQLWPNPVTCYVTPATNAVAAWVAPVVTFDNSVQNQPSLHTTFRVQDTAWNFSTHTFTYSAAGMACDRNLVNVGTRFAKKMKEIGFMCNAVVPANSVSTVTVN